MRRDEEDVIEASYVGSDVPATDLDDAAWNRARAVRLTHYWSGDAAPPGRHAEACVLWSDVALAVRFICRQMEPLIINPAPRTNEKTVGLWERDDCEIYVAPDAGTPEKYFEFEAAPTGEWLDLAIHRTPRERETDWQYRSGMTVASRIAEEHVIVAMRVPWPAFNAAAPLRKETFWRVNLFRCVGAGRDRGYLAWRPTYTAQPDFHVPESFGLLRFSR
ncbi:MAG TPA: carbohydrate-binding family 9-like protein [Pyrinomonadaceae bacterium]|nr:carbohydrate-binding family 9-like protein [Pyrinomonadaceae bacterium]